MAEVITRDGWGVHVEVTGPADGPQLVLADALGTSIHLWDPILPFLPPGLRIIRYDMRGHGLSDVPDPPYKIGQLISDAEAVCDAYNVRDAMFVGMSVGGMVAQGLAVKRPDIIRALVLSNTALKLGTQQIWQDHIDRVEGQGMPGAADVILKGWFGPDFYGSPGMPTWLKMLMNTPSRGYVGVCHAIAGGDFYATTRQIRVPTLGIAGSDDGASPADLVREAVDLVPGSQMVVMWRVGHLARFMRDTGHIADA